MRKFLISIIVILCLQASSVYAACEGLSKKSKPELLFSCLAHLSERINSLERSKKEVTDKTKCPVGMVNAGAFCIDKGLRFSKGTTWFANNKGCIKQGFRMCTVAEISGAAQISRSAQISGVAQLSEFETYDSNTDGITWVWASDAVLTKTEGGGTHDACHVNLNHNRTDNTPLGDWNCQYSANTTSSEIGGICCK